MLKFNFLPRTIKFSILALVLGGVFGLGRLTVNSDNLGQSLRIGGYKFINPLLACDVFSQKKSSELRYLSDEISTQIQSAKNSGQIDNASIYFRDLKTGHWTGNNQDDLYSPASLIKVPLMIAYLELIQQDPKLLSQKLKFEDLPLDTYGYDKLKQADKMQLGLNYTVEDLIYKMIVNSDNNAYYLLLEYMNPETLNEIYTDLDIPNKSDYNHGPDFMTVKEYSLLFRVLYNATYLNRSLSEKALEILSKVKFNQGITAGVPANIAVAHKFGETPIKDKNNVQTNELHDCGVVYNSSGPYLLCIMTKGKDTDKMASFIAMISKTVFNDVEGNSN